MAHFAQLDNDNTVLQVIVIPDEEIMVDGQDSEDKGILFCQSLFGKDTKWKQTSYNTYFNTHKGGKTPFRVNYAVIGGKYDEELDVFLYKQPNHDWKLNLNTYEWDPPENNEYHSETKPWPSSEMSLKNP